MNVFLIKIVVCMVWLVCGTDIGGVCTYFFFFSSLSCLCIITTLICFFSLCMRLRYLGLSYVIYFLKHLA